MRVTHSMSNNLTGWFMKAFTGRVPFNNCDNDLIVMSNILIGVRPKRPTGPHFMDGLWTLTERCWEEKPQDRPRMDSVMEQLSVFSSINWFIR